MCGGRSGWAGAFRVAAQRLIVHARRPPRHVLAGSTALQINSGVPEEAGAPCARTSAELNRRGFTCSNTAATGLSSNVEGSQTTSSANCLPPSELIGSAEDIPAPLAGMRPADVSASPVAGLLGLHRALQLGSTQRSGRRVSPSGRRG